MIKIGEIVMDLRKKQLHTGLMKKDKSNVFNICIHVFVELKLISNLITHFNRKLISNQFFPLEKSTSYFFRNNNLQMKRRAKFPR